MRRFLRLAWCWLHDHRPVTQTTVMMPGRVAVIRQCRCGRSAHIAGRKGRYPVPRRA